MKHLVLLVAFFFMTGCALTDATLDVGHDPEKVQSGPIAEANSVSFVPGILDDRREDKDRIGYKKNGFGMNTADITSDTPVTDIVMNAIVHAVESNGHTVSDSGIAISGSVNQFWVDLDANFWSTEVLGNVEASIAFTGTESGEIVYERIYRGSYSDKVQIITNKSYDAAISGAIGSLVDEIVFDEDLAEALDSL